MVRIVALALFTLFVVTTVCIADEVKGRVSSVNKADKIIDISGVKIRTADAWMEDARDYPLPIERIAAGDYLEADGKFIGASELDARKIERNEPECGAVKGKISSIDIEKRELVISGIVIKVSADAWLEGPGRVKIPLELFAPGYSVKCEGDWTGISELSSFKVTVE